MAFGPLQIIAVGFPDTARLQGRVAAELIALSDAGTIRIVDALAVIKEDDEVDILRVSDLDTEQRKELGAEVGALIGLGLAGVDGFLAGAELGVEVVEEGGLGLVEAVAAELAANLPNESAGLLLIVEHAWAVPLRDAIVDAGGVLLANRWIGAQQLVGLGAALRAEAELEAGA